MSSSRIPPVSTTASVSLPSGSILTPKSVITTSLSISDTIPAPSTSRPYDKQEFFKLKKIKLDLTIKESFLIYIKL